MLRLDETPGSAVGRLASRLGQPVIREAIRAAMQWMADQFVMGETIEEALRRAEPTWTGRALFLRHAGRGARTAEDAARYLRDYEQAVDVIGAHQARHNFARPSGISVKLSALHPRYEMAQRERVMAELAPRLAALCERAARQAMTVTIDAEEAERLHLSLEVVAEALRLAQLGDWQGWALRCRLMTNALRR